jgi:hypothetical protein
MENALLSNDAVEPPAAKSIQRQASGSMGSKPKTDEWGGAAAKSIQRQASGSTKSKPKTDEWGGGRGERKIRQAKRGEQTKTDPHDQAHKKGVLKETTRRPKGRSNDGRPETDPNNRIDRNTRKRVALVIANLDYRADSGDGTNALQDGKDMKKALEEQRFEVELVCNANEATMKIALKDFVESVQKHKPCDSFFFFAGNSQWEDGHCYLLPTDNCQGSHATSLSEDLLSRLNQQTVCHPNALNIIMLDCCREDRGTNGNSNSSGATLPARLTKPHAKSTLKHFLGAVGAVNTATNYDATSGDDHSQRASCASCAVGASQFLIAFGTAPFTVACESQDGRNGIFTGAFLKALGGRLGQPDTQRRNLHDVFMQVAEEVSLLSTGRQEPWYIAGGLTLDFHFGPEELRPGSTLNSHSKRADAHGAAELGAVLRRALPLDVSGRHSFGSNSSTGDPVNAPPELHPAIIISGSVLERTAMGHYLFWGVWNRRPYYKHSTEQYYMFYDEWEGEWAISSHNGSWGAHVGDIALAAVGGDDLRESFRESLDWGDEMRLPSI